MTKREANSKVVKLFNKWNAKFRNRKATEVITGYYESLEGFKDECRQLHNVVGLYGALTDKNALKMASICCSLPFVEPHRMLRKLQETTKTY